VYAIPEEIGLVDIAVYGSILLHLRDPFLALQSGLKLVKDTVVTSEPLHGQGAKDKGAFPPPASKRKRGRAQNDLGGTSGQNGSSVPLGYSGSRAVYNSGLS
jgi:hypothetical protein